MSSREDPVPLQVKFETTEETRRRAENRIWNAFLVFNLRSKTAEESVKRGQLVWQISLPA